MFMSTRKQGPRLAKPTGRYWKGKAPKGITEPLSSDSEEDQRQTTEGESDTPLAGEHNFLRARAASREDLSKEVKVIISGKEELLRSETEESEESEDEPDDASNFFVSESEEEDRKIQLRPLFVPKRVSYSPRNRATMAKKQSTAEGAEERKQAEKRKESHDLVAESIRWELLEKDKEVEPVDVDDTDGLDPLGEFDTWRLRELARIKRDREVEISREQEREEVERRRALPEDQRMKEDYAHAQRLRDEKPKGRPIFLQKYWHKGAFHQDEEVLKRHDFTEATKSTVDVSLLPSVMQVKNFGKRGRTKYTHLLDQDTTAGRGGFCGTGPVKTRGTGTDGTGCFLCGGPHMKKDCPQYSVAHSGNPGTGPNAAPKGIRNEPRSWRDDGDRKTRPANDSGRLREQRSRSVDDGAGGDKRRRLD